MDLRYSGASGYKLHSAKYFLLILNVGQNKPVSGSTRAAGRTILSAQNPGDIGGSFSESDVDQRPNYSTNHAMHETIGRDLEKPVSRA